jgi:2-phospho-L-lactate guanylyltransferase
MTESLAPYVVVVPVKPPAHGKSRLVGLTDEQRRELAEAFALDTVSACQAAASVGAVLVATDDARFSAELASRGCPAIPDGVASDLTAALRQAAAEARRRWPELTPVALCADLPALRPEDLDAALASVSPGEEAFVADADGVGTTLYTAGHEHFVPAFGPDSRAAHLGGGAREVPGALTTLRRDVDDLSDLRMALDLGAGRHTRQVWDGFRLEA